MPASYEAILDACPVERESDRDLLFLAMNRQLNMVPGERPSDCARSAVQAYLSDPASFRTQYGLRTVL
jgi:hypothetical protein